MCILPRDTTLSAYWFNQKRFYCSGTHRTCPGPLLRRRTLSGQSFSNPNDHLGILIKNTESDSVGLCGTPDSAFPPGYFVMLTLLAHGPHPN